MDEGSVASICSRATDMYRPKYRSEKPIAISFERSGSAPPMDTAAIYADRALGDSWHEQTCTLESIMESGTSPECQGRRDETITETGRS